MSDITKSDWTVFKEIREKALATFCEKALDKFRSVLTEAKGSDHEVYLAHYKITREIDKEMAFLFDGGFSRSKAWLLLMNYRRNDLVDQESLSRLTPEFERQSRPF